MYRRLSGFTIVELLVVIVVIGVLASITIVSYTGISAKAIEASITTDLDNALKKFKMHQVENGGYPTTIDCSSATSATNICLKPSANNQYTLTTDNSVANNQYFCISILNTVSNKRLYITNSGITGTGVCPTFTLTIIAGANGAVNISANGSYYPGSTPTITATPNSGYIFSSWSGDASCVGLASHTITMDADKTCTANFAIDPNWIVIGSQVWGRYNLNVGTMVTGVTTQTNNTILEKYCYNNLESNCTTYGGLYQWDEAMQYVVTEGAQGICPTGSHIPSDNDWKILEIQLGMTQAQADATGYRGSDQGARLQSGGSSGLNVPFAGGRYPDGSFVNLSAAGYLWSSSASSPNAWFRMILSGLTIVNRGVADKNDGFLVRCIAN